MANDMMTSSVFLSPPLSNEFSLPNKTNSRVNNEDDIIPFSLLDEDFDDASLKLDVLTECSKKNLVSVVISKILDDLTDNDLLRASQVNQEWRRLIKQEHMKSGRRVSRYIKRAKNAYIQDKENTKAKFLSPPVSSLCTPIPLTQRNIQTDGKRQDSREERTPCTIHSKSSTYRQCPGCQSPARTTFKQIGHCTKCNNEFCIHCFYTENKHSPTCQLVGGSGVSGSITRKLDRGNSSRKYSMGSASNKARLKRL